MSSWKPFDPGFTELEGIGSRSLMTFAFVSVNDDGPV